MENLTHSFGEMNHVLQLVEELRINDKTVMSWSSRKKVHFLKGLYCSKELTFILVYRVLNKRSEYI